MECLKIGRKNVQSYTEVLRSFSITLHFYSPRAYQFIRKKFNDHLPSVTTIRKWHANCTSNAEPGINKECLSAVAALVESFKNEEKTLIVSITFDEMSIRRMIQWNDAKKRFIGYITHGQFVGQIPVARNALVFLITGLNSDFSLPIAHYFVIAPNGREKALIINQVVTEVTKLGVRVANITFDGLSSNLSACEELGASFKQSFMKPFFINPVDSKKVHIFLDACHMLKLARNCIASEKFMCHRPSNSTISWQFFERLESCRSRNDFVCHKLTKKHMQWYRAQMDVRLAAQTLSDSVANAMEHLMGEGVRSFQHCEGTIEFIRTMNKVFDIFNSKKKKKGNVFKSPITISSKETIFNFLSQATTYIQSLTLHGRSIMLSKKKTAFKGMVINIMSLKEIVAEYLDTGLIESVPTFYTSQDPLETLFGRVRSLNGNNDNPSVEQFTSALRKLLIHNEIVSSDLSNCTDQLNILTVSSFRERSIANEGNDQNDDAGQIASFKAHRFCTNDNLLNVFQDSTIVRTADEIENKLKFIARFDCDTCIEVLDIHEKICSDFHKYSPCMSTALIGRIVYKFMDIFKNERDISYDILLETVLQNIDDIITFPNFNCEDDHKKYFINFMAEEFIRARAVYIAKTDTLNEQKLMLRKKLKSAINFQGQ